MFAAFLGVSLELYDAQFTFMVSSLPFSSPILELGALMQNVLSQSDTISNPE